AGLGGGDCKFPWSAAGGGHSAWSRSDTGGGASRPAPRSKLRRTRASINSSTLLSASLLAGRPPESAQALRPPPARPGGRGAGVARTGLQGIGNLLDRIAKAFQLQRRTLRDRQIRKLGLDGTLEFLLDHILKQPGLFSVLDLGALAPLALLLRQAQDHADAMI